MFRPNLQVRFGIKASNLGRSMVITKKAPPCVADARKVAKAIATDGVSAVLLFGSVARGQAGSYSDIDLVVIHDDLDYGTRRDRSSELERLAAGVANHPVFLHVTDWPEWNTRKTDVSSSLERVIAPETVVLFEREPARVRWGKEIGLPSSDREEAAVRLDNAVNALFGLYDHLRMGPAEEAALDTGDPDSYEYAMRRRMSDICAKAQMAMESSLKSLIHLAGARPAQTHDLEALVQALAPSYRTA